jgi:hypothetical protein
LTRAADSSVTVAALLIGNPEHDAAADALAACNFTIAQSADGRLRSVSSLARVPKQGDTRLMARIPGSASTPLSVRP